MQYPDPSPEQIERLYTTFTCLGPVPRTCLEVIPTKNNSSYHDKLVKYLREVDQACRNLIRSTPCPAIEDLLDEESGHQIAIMEPVSKGFAYDTRIITRWIAHKIAEKGEKRQQHNGYLLYKSLCIQPSLQTAAGWFFERYAHDWLRRGGTFHAHELQNRNAPTGDIILTFHTVASPEDRILYFSTTKDLAEQVAITGGSAIKPLAVGKYFLPYSRTQESFDGLLFHDVDTIILFQFTIAARHEVKAHGIKDLLGALPNTIKAIELIFVIPEHRTGNYIRPRTVPVPRAVGRRPENLSITQYKLVFRDRDIESVAVNTRITTTQESGTGSAHGLGAGDDGSQQAEHTEQEDDSDDGAPGPSGWRY
ncbi:hypothetical protein B9Z19DRAFT_1069820 [Tuber borchii]|uniref:Uncharacterized protein n=1 Tax=Tuber borchii TaxID=42251 RepID=A0A2T6ZA46_TUBBO|nr:hypothetical protein B9Z19DRAFT_1069820 [Tuber borchii]